MTGSRQREHPTWATLIVLGVLLLRGLIPAGFMLAPVEGSLAVVLCDMQMSAGDERHVAGHDHGAAHHHGAGGDPTCPYAQSAGPAPLSTLPVLAGGAIPDQLVAPAAFTQTLPTCGPVRRQSPRGPPRLA
jgi:hypothetical protein